MSEKAVVLVSGGMDSCVCAAVAAEKGYRLAFLHVTYGQRTAARERRAFEEIAEFYQVRERLVADIGYLKEIGGSALTDETIPVPQEEGGGIPITYVPFRNAHLLAIATSWAEVIGASRIFIGASEVDFSGYPDCRASFFEAFNRVIEEGTRPETKIVITTPLIRLDKAGIVRLGLRLKAPLHLTWSCYERQDLACGRCESCRLRLKGFAKAGVKDPIAYVGGLSGEKDI
ncbi:7-cyano-7-deazaguanine synthase QueC [Thermosulfuriphilus ammonigenes]|uniref:7-cyano-7-deazaguanine synthase n=1 Tax=Thermosulfuriphilus ammonigenes TaxID=1936021 RepID=A0A6G7PY76_9BACT|nr:7-cyano-7-deazaguanine synthase QueC [Thermosulfuriphilus ammonigenes]MBA2849505.1 7-cyano-7-deazaguanine synthase [Thermosulfuriphilus ammonigenes]QIJ72570.1 7-cyano-7-deazaguanine synthase QueC [Thermosulfuriphilus ammonigenes]